MPPWLQPILGGIGAILSALAKLAAPVMAYLAGKRKAQNKALEDAKDIRDEQVEIGARRPRDRSDILDRMFDKDF